MASLLAAQINLQHSKLATVELNKRNYGITLITEPLIHRGRLAFVERNNYDYIYAEGCKARACIRSTKGLGLWKVNELTDSDLATAVFKSKELNIDIYIASLYLDITLPVRKQLVVELVNRCEQRNIPLLIGADSNAHSALWCAANTNQRGEEVEKLLAELDLMVLNIGNTPTFENEVAATVIDITLANTHAMQKLNIQNWSVEKTNSFSDHR